MKSAVFAAAVALVAGQAVASSDADSLRSSFNHIQVNEFCTEMRECPLGQWSDCHGVCHDCQNVCQTPNSGGMASTHWDRNGEMGDGQCRYSACSSNADPPAVPMCQMVDCELGKWSDCNGVCHDCQNVCQTPNSGGMASTIWAVDGPMGAGQCKYEACISTADPPAEPMCQMVDCEAGKWSDCHGVCHACENVCQTPNSGGVASTIWAVDGPMGEGQCKYEACISTADPPPTPRCQMVECEPGKWSDCAGVCHACQNECQWPNSGGYASTHWDVNGDMGHGQCKYSGCSSHAAHDDVGCVKAECDAGMWGDCQGNCHACQNVCQTPNSGGVASTLWNKDGQMGTLQCKFEGCISNADPPAEPMCQMVECEAGKWSDCDGVCHACQNVCQVPNSGGVASTIFAKDGPMGEGQCKYEACISTADPPPTPRCQMVECEPGKWSDCQGNCKMCQNVCQVPNSGGMARTNWAADGPMGEGQCKFGGCVSTVDPPAAPRCQMVQCEVGAWSDCDGNCKPCENVCQSKHTGEGFSTTAFVAYVQPDQPQPPFGEGQCQYERCYTALPNIVVVEPPTEPLTEPQQPTGTVTIGNCERAQCSLGEYSNCSGVCTPCESRCRGGRITTWTGNTNNEKRKYGKYVANACRHKCTRE